MKTLSLSQDMFGFLASLSFATACVILLSPVNTLYAFIMFGQAHFLLAYLYRWRAGKMTQSYVFWYALIAIPMFAVGIVAGFSDWLSVFTGTLFAAHFMVDEFRMMRLPFSLGRLLISVSFIVTIGAFLAHSVAGMNILLPAFSLSLLYLLVGVGLLWYLRRLSRTDMLMTATASASILLLLYTTPAPQTLLGFIIIFHYVRWYVHYYYRVAHDTLRRNAYIWHTTIINLAIIALALQVPSIGFLGFFFRANFFYLWTILHIVFSYMPVSWVFPFRNRLAQQAV